MEGTARLLAILGFTLLLSRVSALEPKPKMHPAMMPPRLGKPLPDRGPVTDPTRGVSADAVLRAPMPARKRPAPFVALNLPDPFERWETVKLRIALAEDLMPATRFLPLPKR